MGNQHWCICQKREFLVFDLAHSYFRDKRASKYYFVAYSTNKLTKMRQCNSHMEQCRKLSSFWVTVRTKNPTAKKLQQLGIKAGAGMEGRGMTGHSHRERAALAHGKAHNGTLNTMGFFACLCYSRSIYANWLNPCIFSYCFPVSKGLWVTLCSKYSHGFTLKWIVCVAQWNHVLPVYCDKCRSNFTQCSKSNPLCKAMKLVSSFPGTKYCKRFYFLSTVLEAIEKKSPKHQQH